MVTPEYCRSMARYNGWQNRQLKAAFAKLDDADLRVDRGAFFGSILATANHLLWADALWLARLTGVEGPGGGIAESPDYTSRREEWEIARFHVDASLLDWADRLRSIDLTGDLTWYSGAAGRDISKPRWLCIVHLFNHQTHHRGQIHAMLGAAGAEPPVTDLPFMPDSGPWV